MCVFFVVVVVVFCFCLFFLFFDFFFFFFFQNSYLMVMPVETWATIKETIAKMYAFVHRSVMEYTET